MIELTVSSEMLGGNSRDFPSDTATHSPSYHGKQPDHRERIHGKPGLCREVAGSVSPSCLTVWATFPASHVFIFQLLPEHCLLYPTVWFSGFRGICFEGWNNLALRLTLSLKKKKKEGNAKHKWGTKLGNHIRGSFLHSALGLKSKVICTKSP